MQPSVYADLLTCLYGSSFGAPIGAPVNQVTGLLDEVTKGLPINGAAENLVGGIVKRNVVPTTLGNKVPVGQVADGLTGNRVENIVGGLAKGANVGSVVPSSTEKGLDGLPVGSENELLKDIPLVGGGEKPGAGLPVGDLKNLPVGSELLKNIPIVGGKKKRDTGLPVGDLKNLPVGSELLKNIPIVGGEEKRDTGLPVGDLKDLPVGSELLKNIPIIGGEKSDTGLPVGDLKDLPVGSELLKNIPIVGGEESDTGLPLGNVDQILKPVTSIVDGPLKGHPAGI